MGRKSINLDETDLVKRLHRLEELVLSGRTPEPVAGESVDGVLKGDGTEEPSFKRIDADEAAVAGSEVVTQADGVAQHGLGDGAAHGTATLAELNTLLSDAAVRGESDFFDTDAGSIKTAAFDTLADVPGTISEGTIVSIRDEEKLYTVDSGGALAPVTPDMPIAQVDAVETFGEPDVQVSHFATRTSSQSIETDVGDVSGTYTFNNIGSGSSSTTIQGVVIAPKTDASGVTFTISNSFSYPADRAMIRTGDGSEVLAETTTSAGATETLHAKMYSDQEYQVVVEGGAEDGSESFPIYFTGFNVTAGVDNDSISDSRVGRITELSLIGVDAPMAHIGWDSPSDIFRWDASTFQITEDGGSIEVYVEESTDGGSTWTEIDGPINRGDMITAAADSDVRFRVEFGNFDTNNPTLDSIYRRYVV